MTENDKIKIVKLYNKISYIFCNCDMDAIDVNLNCSVDKLLKQLEDIYGKSIQQKKNSNQ